MGGASCLPDLDYTRVIRSPRYRRIGKKKAAVAVGHSILVICWHLLANNADYDDLGGDYFARRGNTDRDQDRLVQQLQDLGYSVTLKKIAA